MSARNR